MSEPQGNFKMRFKCGPNGRLLKGAPGNYECGKVYRMPFRHSKFTFWEPMEELPQLKVPDMSEEESVYEEAIFLPEDETESYDEALVEMTPSTPNPEDYNVDPDADAVIEPYMKLDLRTGKMRGVTEEEREAVKGSGEAVYAPEEDKDSPITNRGVAMLDADGGIVGLSDLETEQNESLDRDALKLVLDEAGIEYSNRAHTPTLQALVDELESEEES